MSNNEIDEEKQQATEMLLSNGLTPGSFMVFSAKEDIYTKCYGMDKAEKLDFSLEEERINKYDLPFLSGDNNGMHSMYLPNGIVVVSRSAEMGKLIKEKLAEAQQEQGMAKAKIMQGMAVPFSNQEQISEPKEMELDRQIMEKTCEKIREIQDIKRDKEARETVTEKLEALGIEKGTYIMLTDRDLPLQSKCTFGDAEITTFHLEQCQAAETEEGVIASYNAGVVAFCFSEGVYVACPTPNDKAFRAANEIENKTRKGLGVYSFNHEGEVFTTIDGKPCDKLNKQWAEAVENNNKQAVKSRQEEAGLEFSEVLYKRGFYNR